METEHYGFKFDRSKPLVLLLGNITHEGVVSALAAAGRQYKQKYPESSAENWETILSLFDQFDVREVIWKVSKDAYCCLSDRDYLYVSNPLIAKIADRPHILFVHQDLLSGNVDEFTFGVPEDEAKQIVEVVHYAFEEAKLNVLPYAKNAEVTVLASEFIAGTEQGLLLRVYVPTGRMWSQETDRLLQLFRDYLSRVSKVSVRLDQTRTDLGIIYEFHGEKSSPSPDLSTEFEHFSRFLDLCAANPEAAQQLLASRDVPAGEIADILARYGKEARRLQVDLKHDRERKLLGIRQRMESELVDLVGSTATKNVVDAMVDSVVPAIAGIISAVQIDQSPLRIPGPTTPTNLTVNLNPQIIHAVGSIVAQELRGDAHLTQQDQDLLALIQEHGGDNAPQLASAVHELADPTAPKPGRLMAKQRLSKFLIGVGSRLGDVAAGVLQKYIENQLGV